MMEIVNKNDIDKALAIIENATLDNINVIVDKLFKVIIDRLLGLFSEGASIKYLTYLEYLKYNRSNMFERFVINNVLTSRELLYISIHDSLIEIFQSNFLYQSYLMESKTGQTLPKEELSPLEIQKEFVLVSVAGETVKDRVYKWSAEFFLIVKDRIEIMIKQEKPFIDIKKELEYRANVFKFNLKRLYTSENTRMISESTELIYDRAKLKGIEFEKQWIATLDNRTRDAHRVLDGQIADNNGYFYYNGYKSKAPAMFKIPALDVNCRCTTIAKFKDISPEVRKENINKKPIIKFKNYEQWIKEYKKR